MNRYMWRSSLCSTLGVSEIGIAADSDSEDYRFDSCTSSSRGLVYRLVQKPLKLFGVVRLHRPLLFAGVAQWKEHCATNAGFVGVRLPPPVLILNDNKEGDKKNE